MVAGTIEARNRLGDQCTQLPCLEAQKCPRSISDHCQTGNVFQHHRPCIQSHLGRYFYAPSEFPALFSGKAAISLTNISKYVANGSAKPIGRRIGRRIKGMKQGRQENNDLAADLMRLHQEKTAFDEAYLRKMIMTNFGAGHETLASTLTSVMAMIGTHPSVAQRLSDEFSNSGLTMTPYLSAVIKETKRLHPVIAAALPRRVPRGGLSTDGFFVPAGITVGCSPIALQRNEDICGPDPEAFSPARWLDDADRAKDMEHFSLSWGGGARTCPGRHLAEMIVHVVIPRLVQEFEVEVDMPNSRDMPSYFLSIMTGVVARFRPREKSRE